MTNLEKIQTMTAKELAQFISAGMDCRDCPIHEHCHCRSDFEKCNETWEDWLNQDSDASELKPCPFCGGIPKINDRGNGWFYVSCENEYCPVMPETCNEPTKEDAIETWNRRHNDE